MAMRLFIAARVKPSPMAAWMKSIKKHPNTNTKQSRGIRQRMQSVLKRQNEQLPVSPFQRDTMQTKSMQEEVRGNWVI